MYSYYNSYQLGSFIYDDIKICKSYDVLSPNPKPSYVGLTPTFLPVQ